MDTNSSHDTINSSTVKDTKRQQFTNKQRMDMYAFCVLELEMHSNKVSIKKRQQAIRKVLYEQKKEIPKDKEPNSDENQNQSSQTQSQSQPQLQPPVHPSPQSQSQPQSQILIPNQEPPPPQPPPPPPPPPPQEQEQNPSQHQQQQEQPPPTTQQPSQKQQDQQPTSDEYKQNDTDCNSSEVEGKTLLQLQQEVALTRKCYSDYQKTQVLTSSMLRDVQKRFSKYYPDSAIPSRTTIKHVFEKCVAHGTVENIRTPRKVTKIPQGNEIEYLLIHEPQLSLRQMAQKLNVSTGTVSRRCKALGLVPESVTIKHQQLATARRQKQIKQLESQSKPVLEESEVPQGASTNGINSHAISSDEVATFT